MAAVLEQDGPALNAAVEQNDEPAIISALDAHPALVTATDPRGRAPRFTGRPGALGNS
jgi:hypothetical protein